MSTKFIDEDFVAVWRKQADKKAGRRTTLTFGDEVEVLEDLPGWTRVRVVNHFDGRAVGFVEGQPRLRDSGILRFSMIDVQQGDGAILETPSGKIVFIDGGDNKLFARHAAARFLHRASSAANPLVVDALIVTHGDADHFSGLSEIYKSEALPETKARKRLFIRPLRVFTNGLVKAPSAVSERNRLGTVVDIGNERFIVDLFDDPRDAGEAALNQDFRTWAKALNHWETRGAIDFQRVAHGMDEEELFDFLHEEGIGVEIQGPFTDSVEHDGATVQALPFLRAPRLSPEIALQNPADDNAGSRSVSHTINGHSVALRLTFGNVRMSLTGDLNQAGMRRMFAELAPGSLEAEIAKAPHHGSHEFDFAALKAIRPTVALVSSGDENAFHEHIHPRATLMAALGQSIPGEVGVLLSTELTAFFHTRDLASQRESLKDYFKTHEKDDWNRDELVRLFAGQVDPGDPPAFFSFERTNFGIIHIRTDGERLLVFTHSGKENLNEAYRLRVRVDSAGARQISFEEVQTR